MKAQSTKHGRGRELEAIFANKANFNLQKPRQIPLTKPLIMSGFSTLSLLFPSNQSLTERFRQVGALWPQSLSHRLTIASGLML